MIRRSVQLLPFLFLLSLLFPSLAFAATYLPSTISSDMELSKAGSPYVIPSYVTVNSGVTLTIDPGVIVKSNQNGYLVIEGALDIQGTAANPVEFTTFDDDSVGGDLGNDGQTPITHWGGMVVGQGGTATIDHLITKYGGYVGSDPAQVANFGGVVSITNTHFLNSPGWNSFFSGSGDTSITNSEFGYSSGIGIGVKGGVVDIQQTDFHDNVGAPVWVKYGSVHVVNSLFERNQNDLIVIYYPATFTHENNSISNNFRGGITVSGAISSDTLWNNDNNIPYLPFNLTVNVGNVLTIDPGTIIKFYPTNGNLIVAGNLQVNGTTEKPVRFTSFYDDSIGGDIGEDGNTTAPALGDWQVITTTSGGTIHMSHADIAYGGHIGYYNNYWPATGNNDGTIDLRFVKLHDNRIGFFNSSGNAVITNSLFTKNDIGFVADSGNITIHESSISGNNNGGYVPFFSLPVVDATNNWWGDATGPHHYISNPSGLGQEVGDKITFSPWLTSDPFEASMFPVCCSNVLFLPGLEASRLYKKGGILNPTDQLWEPNIPSDVNDLFLNADGSSINNIFTKDVIDSTNLLGSVGALDIYKSLIGKLNSLVSLGKIKEWKPFAYDWRLGIDDLVQNGTKYENDQMVTLVDTLQMLINSSNNGKVTIIAHSNGGLLAKALIKKLEDMKLSGQNTLIDHIDNLILVASPQVGTPDGLSALLHGYKQTLPLGIMTEVQARKLANNMPSAYGLLPSKQYYNLSSISNVGVFSSTTNPLFITAYGDSVDSYQKEHNFVLGAEGRIQPADSDLINPIKGNSLLLSKAESLHDSIDTMIFPQNINVIDVAGWGKSTVKGVMYTDTDIQPIFTIQGDQTVVMQSALYGQGTKYWIDLSNSTLSHASILEDPQLLDFIGGTIQQNTPNTAIQNIEPVQIGNRMHLSVHSPVSIGVYDLQGDFTGKVCDSNTGNCVVQENIPGSSYFEFGEGKYVNVDQGKIQKAVLQGTDVGTFTLNSDIENSSGQITSAAFIDIPVTTQTQGEVVINNGIPQINLDVTGDGTTDYTISPNSNFDPIMYLRIMKSTIDSLDIPKSQIKNFDNRVDSIIKLIQKGKIDKAKLKTGKFESVLVKKLTKPDPKNPKVKKLSKTDAQLLLDMLNGLLDNLN